MAQNEQYVNPPIAEASITLVFKRDGAICDSNESAYAIGKSMAGEEYPETTTVQRKSAQQDQAVTKQDSEEQADAKPNHGDESGHAFRTEDRRKMFFITPHTWHFAWVLEYPGWTAFSSELTRLIEALRQRADGLKVDGISLRYLNLLTIPTNKGISLATYLRTLPDLSADLSAFTTLSDYFMSLTLHDAKAGAKIELLQGLADTSEDNVTIMLDIDVHKESDLPAFEDGEGINRLLEALHNCENQTFESSITQPARDLFNDNSRATTAAE
ncbi:MAG: TIGR04255 family protein [Planctomycetota bacterium]